MSERMTFLPRADVLDFEELLRLCQVFVKHGVKRLRITGGEPLVRRDIGPFFEELGQWLHHPEQQGTLEELTLTTNGSRLALYAQTLFQAGVRRVNVSLDTLDDARFTRITRRGKLSATLEGIRAAREVGLAVRVNAVAMAGVNEDEFDAMLAWCGEISADLCLIETMPMGDTGEDRTARYLPLSNVKADLARRWTLEPLADRTGGPARYMRVAETGQRIGFITPMSHNFCATCNRVRLSCTGQLYTCLGHEDGVDLRAILRSGGDDAAILAGIQAAIDRKPLAHDFMLGSKPGEVAGPVRHMSVTGG
ncbi:molybdenum cofactor biosynthesis protein A [Acetobacter orleanensis NRIC 0473]|uniref:Cyclic pyranopterin monophosphate synthase n=2 Tax=Acetobacter orleanensis TaxID=104099 RepID=A0A4Y3TJQ2_9PROT|nr:molybdenum cofactor biosynthesis protein A [Acetobacter orleanensis JCM 7639]GBR30820.1 molybdenum cofactor biosynthesis protein A [Acetobacter orleanensis NRIC 0473]GEB81699.1 cyclic pyranopterin monophosphate synthase [Acetobacter orleanensis]